MIYLLLRMFLKVHLKITILWKSFSTMGTLIWFLPSMCLHITLRTYFTEKLFLQWIHWYRFPHCVSLDPLEDYLCEKALLQWVHWYEFSPVCVFIWQIRIDFTEKLLLQWVHLYGFSPLCIFKYTSRLHFSEKLLLQWVHW